MHHFDVQRNVDDDGLSVSSGDSGYDKTSTTSLNSDGTPTYASYRKYLDSYGKKEFRSVRPPKIETNLKSEIFINLENSDQTDHRPINITINLNGEGIKVDKNECTINVMNKPSEEPSKTGHVANMSKNVFNAKPSFVKPTPKPVVQKIHLENTLKALQQKPIHTTKIEETPIKHIQVKVEESAVKKPIHLAQIQDSPVQSLKPIDASVPPPPPPMMMMAQAAPKIQLQQKQPQPKLQKPNLTPKTATDELKDSVINEIKTFGRSSLRKRSEAYVPQNNYQFTRSFANESRNNYNTLPKGWKTNKPEPKTPEEKTVPPTTDVNKDDPNMKKLVYNHYRNMLGAYNAKANNFISTLPRHRVVEDKGISEQLQSIALQGGLDHLNGRVKEASDNNN
ncbi:PREDICTED: putative uncharacterized protein DDB_G0285869 [Nicrophorus vespilloides]|uniref:WH2 domain-containing protein n=1 Tax=Nicrophorus vespilloides TaxID=110193 RepID=A0ABM1N7B4_NICVS|nr:PREDICTED: putative uncharacterized protein DDB_G0285869 [Nicrophorus vespilloides]